MNFLLVATGSVKCSLCNAICLFWRICQAVTLKTRRVLLNENYSSQRARRWWAITSPLAPGSPFPGWPGAGPGPRLRNDDVRLPPPLPSTLAPAEPCAGASAQACCSVRRQAARTKGGGKRCTGQRASYPIERPFSPGIVWHRRH